MGALGPSVGGYTTTRRIGPMAGDAECGKSQATARLTVEAAHMLAKARPRWSDGVQEHLDDCITYAMQVVACEQPAA